MNYRNLFSVATVCTLSLVPSLLPAHCQMPCGIYHDAMVYDQIDQYIETMVKAAAELNHMGDSKSVKDKNNFIRWVMEKEKASDEMATLITVYFLQQKIKPGEPDTAERLASAHQLLFLLTAIKQNVDTKVVDQFAQEWDKFKIMFHVEGYECKVESLRLKKLEELKKKPF